MVQQIQTHNRTTAQVDFSPSNVANNRSKFSDILNESLQNSSVESSNKAVPPLVSKVNEDATAASIPTLVGRTSQSSPTVSQLLLTSDKLGDRGWEIIYSETNRNKPYKKIPLGTPIYYNNTTGELTWPSSPQNGKLATSANDKTRPETSLETPTSPVAVGRIDHSHPTVSHVLQASEEFSDNKWNILAAAANRSKNFNTIRDGAEVQINPRTNEITWSYPSSADMPKIAAAVVLKSSTPMEKPQTGPPLPSTESADLTDAVQLYLGTPYKEIDCYNLLVKGLKQMGLPYFGKDGIRNRLTDMAREKGLPSNAFLNGEGIVKVAGREVLSTSFNRVNDPVEEAGKTFERMASVLQKGQILSFSTPTRGHTGIISQHNDQWTFINSGRMDNPISEANSSKEVGEENLLDEVQNWFKTANKNSESLVVTLGQLEEEKIRKNFNPEFSVSRRL